MGAKRLEKLRRDFLWGVGAETKKHHLVNRDIMCSEKVHGGLG